jgi:hypothetical protein
MGVSWPGDRRQPTREHHLPGSWPRLDRLPPGRRPYSGSVDQAGRTMVTPFAHTAGSDGLRRLCTVLRCGPARPHSCIHIAPHLEPFSSCVARVLGMVEDEDGLHDRGGAAWAAAQLSQDPVLKGGDGVFADRADAGVGAVDRLLRPRQPRIRAIAAWRSSAVAASRVIASRMYRHAVVTLTAKPAAKRVRVSPLRKWARANRACRPGSTRRQRERRCSRRVRIRAARWFRLRVDSAMPAG